MQTITLDAPALATTWDSPPLVAGLELPAGTVIRDACTRSTSAKGRVLTGRLEDGQVVSVEFFPYTVK